MDDEILKTVESMLGKDIKIVDCEKTSSVREEEVLLINGIPVQLEGDDGLAIKSALMTGQMPPCDLLNQLLYRAGIIRQPVHLETSLSVKSSVIRKEEVTVARDGRILDERSSETYEDNVYTSFCQEVWEPIDKLGTMKTIIPIPIDRYLMNGAGRECGDAFLIAPPKSNSALSSILLNSPPAKFSQSMANKQQTTAAAATAGIPANNKILSSSSSLSSLSATASSMHHGEFSATNSGKLRSHTDYETGAESSSNRALTISPLPVTFSQQINSPQSPSSRTRPTTIKEDTKKSLVNCMSYDSGNDDVFNSLSQSNFYRSSADSSSTANPYSGDSERDDDDVDHYSHRQYRSARQRTPNIHSNSISSCYDFISSSDETDRRSSCSSSNASITREGHMQKTPTIFGTLASDQCPKDNINRKGLPQTTSTNSSSGGKTNEKPNYNSRGEHQHSTASSKSQTTSPALNLTNNSQSHSLQQQQQQQTQFAAGTASIAANYHKAQPQSIDRHNRSYGSIDTDENTLVYRDGNLISGPLDTLIQHMVPTADYYPDRSYLFAFLLSARLFIRPHELLARICQLCEEQQDLNNFLCCNDSIGNTTTSTAMPTTTTTANRHNVNGPEKSIVGNVKLSSSNNSLSLSSLSCNEMENCSRLRAFAQNFVRLLAEWIDTFLYDFRDERLMQHVRSMTRKCIAIDSSLRKDVQTMLQNLLQRLTILEKYEEFLLTLSHSGTGGDMVDSSSTLQNDQDTTTMIGTINAANSSKSLVLTIQNNLHSSGSSTHDTSIGPQLNHAAASNTGGSLTNSSMDITELCSNPTLLAHQLTHIELERLSYIGPEEFVQAFAKENPHFEQSFSDMKKTRNLESYVQWFNRLSYLVATEIVKHPKKKQRVRIVEYWIETARECFNIGNFNSLMAIIAGLNMSPISRLKKTWAKVQSAKFSVLEHQMDPSSNFNSYRSTLKAAMWRSAGATDERERIVIPFFSLLVKDLYFLNEGCSNKLSNGHINFEKFWQLAKQVTEFIAWKQVTCPFEKLSKVLMFLQTNCILNENTLAIASFECEPPENNHEKDRFKTLKSEKQQLQQQ